MSRVLTKLAVGVAHVLQPGGEVGRVAGGERDAALRGDQRRRTPPRRGSCAAAPRSLRARRRARCCAGGGWSGDRRGVPPVSVTFPESCGAASDPRAVASTRSCPRSLRRPLGEERVGKLERQRAGHPASSPGPDSGMRPEPWMSRPPCRGDAGGAELHRPAAKLAGRHDGERRQRIVRQHPGADALAAQVEADGGVGERPAHAAPAGQRCRAARGSRRPGRRARAGTTAGRGRGRGRRRRAEPSPGPGPRVPPR